MTRYNPKRLTFNHWAMAVYRRPSAAASVALHRLQRMTVHGPRVLHNAIRSLECKAFERATTSRLGERVIL